MPVVQPTEQEPSDHEVLRQAQAGSATAFTVLVDRYYADILHYLLGQAENQEQAHDLAQETFLDAFRALDSIPDDRSFRAWLFVTARNNLRHRRRQGRIRRVLSLDRMTDRSPRAPSEMTVDDPSQQLVDEAVLHEIFSELTPTLRVMLDLVGEGYSIREIADELDIGYPAARQRVSRAMRYVRDRYDDLGLWMEETR